MRMQVFCKLVTKIKILKAIMLGLPNYWKKEKREEVPMFQKS